MRILVEATFPVFVGSLGKQYLHVDRVVKPTMADEELVRFAAETGYSAVVFVGRAALARRDLVSAATRYRIALVATEATNPIVATDYLTDSMSRLRKEIAPGRAILVQAAGPRVWKLEDLIPIEAGAPAESADL